jgi:hypothetical protein
VPLDDSRNTLLFFSQAVDRIKIVLITVIHTTGLLTYGQEFEFQPNRVAPHCENREKSDFLRLCF